MSVAMSYLLPIPSTPSPALRAHHPNPHTPSLPTRISISPTLNSKNQDPENPTPNAKRKPTIRSRLSQLCKDGRLDLARRLFDALPRPAPTLLWNTLLIGYVCNAMPDEALRLYALMNAPFPSPRGAAPRSDPYTYSSALKACADARHLRLGKSIHSHILRRSPSPPKNPVLHNSLLNMYASSLDPPCIDVVRILFDRMPKRNAVAWNTLIGWYVRSQRPADALAQFRLMIKVGIRPTGVSFVNVFPAVAAGMEGKDCADMLYGLLIKHGHDYVNDVFVVSSAILMFSELLEIPSARQVFDLSAQKNIEIWNTMISGYIQNDCSDEALALFIQILESDTVAADAVTFLASLMAVSQWQDMKLGQQIHACLIKENPAGLPLVLCNALVVMYSRCGCVPSAFELFHQMLERDVVSWNTMISALVQNGLDLEGLLLVYEMQKQGFCVDSVAVIALLSAASNVRSLRIGKETHGYLIRHRIQCQGLESYLIDMYAKSGSVETARRLFDGGRSDGRDQVIWNAMIAGYMQSGQVEQAILLFRKMLEESLLTPNSVTLSSLLPACNLVGGIQTGRQIHGYAIRRYLDSNVFVDTALVDMYSKCGGIPFAERVFDGMVEKNTVTYTTMISGLGQHGLGEKALSLFQTMQEFGTKPDSVTFVAVISACSYAGLVDEGLAVFESMQEFGIVATPEHYCCIVDLLGRAGRVEEAYEFIQGLGDEGNYVGIWGSLLAACKIHGKLELGELVSKRLFEIDGENGEAGYHVLLSNAYAAEGRWENVDRVRKEMKERGLRKELGLSWIKVGDASHRFMSRDQKHSENEQIYAMLEELALEMKPLPGYKPVDPCLVDELSEFD